MIEVERIDRSGLAVRVSGTVSEYTFRALFHQEHGAIAMLELGNSGIEELTLQWKSVVVFRWRGEPDIEPANPEVEDLVVRICTELPAMLPFRAGERIKLLARDDPDSVEVGSTGIVLAVRFQAGWMQIDVDWDNGLRLMLSVPPDRVEVCM